MTYTDTGVAGGTHTYYVRVADSFGNSQTSPGVSITVTGGGGTNTPPTASFTTSVTGRTVNVNGSASSDPNGSISSYSWNWGDNTASGSGVTASHTYTADGTYTVTLTVTDNQGATATTTRSVTVGAPPAATVAEDTFTRTVASGWGTANTGGAWTVNGAGFSTDGSTGVLTLSAGSITRTALLSGVSSAASDLTTSIQLDKRPSASAAWIGATGRRVGSAEYRLKVRIDTSGALQLHLVKVEGSESLLTSSSIAGTYAANAKLNVRLQVAGTSPTTLRAKAWLSTASEPAAWQVTSTDSTASLQAAGSVGVHAYMSGSATNSPWTIRFDDFTVVPA